VPKSKQRVYQRRSGKRKRRWRRISRQRRRWWRRQVCLTATGATVPVRLVNFSRVVVATATNDVRVVRRRPWQLRRFVPGKQVWGSVIVGRFWHSRRMPTGRNRQNCSTQCNVCSDNCSGWKVSADNVHPKLTQCWSPAMCYVWLLTKKLRPEFVRIQPSEFAPK